MVNASFDGISAFNPSVSIQTDALSIMQQSRGIGSDGSPLGFLNNNDVSAIESQTHQSQVHNLYNKLIAGDLESSRKKTQI